MPRKDRAHYDTKQGNNDRPRKDLTPDQKKALLQHGSDWVNVTEVRIKYEFFPAGAPRPVTYQITFDPGRFDSFIMSPQKCEQVDPKAEHILLSPDGSGAAWEDLRAKLRDAFQGPVMVEEPGIYSTEHSPLCVHDDSCVWYCMHS